MERSLWSFVALLSEHGAEADQRLRHLRLLWLKQLAKVSNEGGISLKIGGINMSYTNVLQVRD